MSRDDDTELRCFGRYWSVYDNEHSRAVAGPFLHQGAASEWTAARRLRPRKMAEADGTPLFACGRLLKRPSHPICTGVMILMGLRGTGSRTYTVVGAASETKPSLSPTH